MNKIGYSPGTVLYMTDRNNSYAGGAKAYDGAGNPLEIERKYLVRIPDLYAIENIPGRKIFAIEQIYLEKDGDICSARIRKRRDKDSGCEEFFINRKYRVSDLTHIERESMISAEEYDSLKNKADRTLSPINKTRYAFPYLDKIFELDVYDFWNDRATLEIELSCESEEFTLPPFIEVVKEVTGDKRYKNLSLAREIIEEKI